jgi:hypothetical protein
MPTARGRARRVHPTASHTERKQPNAHDPRHRFADGNAHLRPNGHIDRRFNETDDDHLGAAAAIGGVAVLLVSTLLHPAGSDPADLTAALTEYAADGLWVCSHLGQFLGVAMVATALGALAGTFEPSPGAAWASLGGAGAAVTVAVATALQAVDGVAPQAHGGAVGVRRRAGPPVRLRRRLRSPADRDRPGQSPESRVGAHGDALRPVPDSTTRYQDVSPGHLPHAAMGADPRQQASCRVASKGDPVRWLDDVSSGMIDPTSTMGFSRPPIHAAGRALKPTDDISTQ